MAVKHTTKYINEIIFFVIHAAKTCCIAFVFYSKTFVYQNCGETVGTFVEMTIILTNKLVKRF